jgi:hypothetical protein
MDKKIIFRQNPNLEQIEMERHLRFKNLSDAERIKETLHLIKMSILLGGEKKPQGKGVIITKKRIIRAK